MAVIKKININGTAYDLNAQNMTDENVSVPGIKTFEESPLVPAISGTSDNTLKAAPTAFVQAVAALKLSITSLGANWQSALSEALTNAHVPSSTAALAIAASWNAALAEALGSGEAAALAQSIDTDPVSGSTKHITSGGVYTQTHNTPKFTYVVDSNNALQAWANNTAGNDYTSVLVKSGSWTSARTINLTTTGTKRVIGEAGASISVTPSVIAPSTADAIKYDTMPTDSDYYIDGISVYYNANELTGTLAAVTGFSNCRVRNCNATATGYTGASTLARAFTNCDVNNCEGSATGAAFSYVFANCTGSDCDGTADTSIFFRCAITLHRAFEDGTTQGAIFTELTKYMKYNGSNISYIGLNGKHGEYGLSFAGFSVNARIDFYGFNKTSSGTGGYIINDVLSVTSGSAVTITDALILSFMPNT